MASDRDLKTLPRQRIVCSAGDGAPAQRFSDDERLRAAPLEPREGLSQAKTLLPLGRSVSKKRTIYANVLNYTQSDPRLTDGERLRGVSRGACRRQSLAAP